MGSQTDYSFVYDDLYRLTSATGSNKGSNHEDMYTLKMAYNSVHSIVKKEQLHQFKSPNATNWSPRNKTTYTYNYQYGTAQPHAPIKIGNYSYTYDANGNQTGWDDNNSGQQRQILWDEENRIKAIEDNGALFSYVYDAGGERVLKSNGGGAQVSVNGSPKGGNGSIGNYTVYVNPYVVIRNGGATKHFYIESQRIATKILESKDGLLQNVTTTSTAPAGNRTVDYAKKQSLLENDLNLTLAKIDGEAGNSGNTPPNGNAYGWANGNNGGTNNGNGGTNGNGNNGGTNNGGTNNGGGTGTGGNNGGGNTGGGNGNNVEKFVFYYHPDHLGSSSYITDVNGEVGQHIEYFAFGETFVEEHSNTSNTPYKFNAKELDDETGLYYYGARYYDPKTSVWQSVDPLADYNPHMNDEHYVDGEHNGGVFNSRNNNPFIYTYQSPVIYIDPNGKQSYFSGPHKHGNSTFTVWQVNVNERLVSFNQRSGRYEERNIGTNIKYRMRSSDSKLNRYMGNEVSYSIKDKNGKWSQMSTQSTGRSDVAGLIKNKYNPIDMERVESTRKAGNMINNWGDKITKGGIIFGGVPSIIGTGIGFVGTGFEMTADHQEGKYNAMGTKGVIYMNSEILGVAGDKVIDGTVKNPIMNKATKLLYQQTVKSAGDAVNNKADKKQK